MRGWALTLRAPKTNPMATLPREAARGGLQFGIAAGSTLVAALSGVPAKLIKYHIYSPGDSLSIWRALAWDVLFAALWLGSITVATFICIPRCSRFGPGVAVLLNFLAFAVTCADAIFYSVTGAQLDVSTIQLALGVHAWAMLKIVVVQQGNTSAILGLPLLFALLSTALGKLASRAAEALECWRLLMRLSRGKKAVATLTTISALLLVSRAAHEPPALSSRLQEADWRLLTAHPVVSLSTEMWQLWNPSEGADAATYAGFGGIDLQQLETTNVRAHLVHDAADAAHPTPRTVDRAHFKRSNSRQRHSTGRLKKDTARRLKEGTGRKSTGKARRGKERLPDVVLILLESVRWQEYPLTLDGGGFHTGGLLHPLQSRGMLAVSHETRATLPNTMKMLYATLGRAGFGLRREG